MCLGMGPRTAVVGDLKESSSTGAAISKILGWNRSEMLSPRPLIHDDCRAARNADESLPEANISKLIRPSFGLA